MSFHVIELVVLLLLIIVGHTAKRNEAIRALCVSYEWGIEIENGIWNWKRMNWIEWDGIRRDVMRCVWMVWNVVDVVEWN